MSDNFLITGYHGKPHVTAENDRGINAAMFGTGRFVLPVGEQFRAEYIGNNIIRMYDGKLMDNGAAAGIPSGEYVDFVIANTGQGNNRNDLIVFQYEQDASTLIESGKFVVVQGTETMDTPSDPTLTQGDLLSDDTAFDQFALWRISINSGAIAAPTQLFTVHTNVVEHAANQSNPHKVTKAQVGLGNVPNVATNNQTPTFTAASTLATLTSGEKLSTAFGKIAKAITDLISHIANKSNPHGVTASQLGAVPTSRKINNKALSGDITLSASDIGAVSTSGSNRINGDLALGGNDTTEQHDLYIRRVVDSNYKSGRLYWGSDGSLVLQSANTPAGSSSSTIFNSFQLRTDDTFMEKPLTVKSGVSLFNGDVRLGSDDNTSTHDLYLYRKLGEDLRNARLYINDNGYLRLNYSNPTANTILNSLKLYGDRTEFDQKLAINSGGTGATTAADARYNLGLGRKLKAYDLTGSNVTNGAIGILKSNWSSISTGSFIVNFTFTDSAGNSGCRTWIGAKKDSNNGAAIEIEEKFEGFSRYVLKSGTWTEQVYRMDHTG